MWRGGALDGELPANAFQVRCGEEENPPEVLEAGQIHAECTLMTRHGGLRFRVVYFCDA